MGMKMEAWKDIILRCDAKVALKNRMEEIDESLKFILSSILPPEMMLRK